MIWPFEPRETVILLAATITSTVALLGVLATILFSSKNFRREMLKLKADLSKKDMEVVAFKIKFQEDFQKWADEGNKALSEAIHLCDLEPARTNGESFFDRRQRLKVTLSALIDKGRWFYPNIEAGEWGADKQPAFRGYRHQLLDSLVNAYRCMSRMDCANKSNNSTIRVDLLESKRQFVSQVQIILDPRTRLGEFQKIIDEMPKKM